MKDLLDRGRIPGNVIDWLTRLERWIIELKETVITAVVGDPRYLTPLRILRQSFADGDATPSVLTDFWHDTFEIANGSPTAVTHFDDGFEGQTITLFFTNGNTTITHDAALIYLTGGVSITPAANTLLTLRLVSGVWRQIGSGGVSGPYVLKAGDTMPGPGGLIIAPAAAITDGLLELHSPGTDNNKKIFDITHNAGTPLMSLTEGGSWESHAYLAFNADRGVQSNSGGAKITFPAGGSATGDIHLDTLVGSGLIRSVWEKLPIGGAKRYSYDGVDGTARPVLGNEAGDVVYGLGGSFFVRDSVGNIATNVITATAPGGAFNLFDDDGTNTLQLIVNANGSVDVQRTAGSRTYKVVLDLIWL